MKQNCTKKPLSELLTQHTDVEKVSDVKKERYITLSSYGNGAHERVIKDGKYPVPFSGYRVSAGQFIYSRIDARNGAYDIIPSELDGCVVSKDFPVFDVDTSLVLPRFLLKSVLSSSFIEQVRLSSFGATNRMRIKEDVFGSYLINIPPLEEQAKIVECLDKVQSIIDFRRSEINRMDELIKARFVEMFGDPVNNPLENKVFSLDEVCTKITDGTHDTPERYSDGYLLITGKNIRSTGIILDDVEYVSEADHRIIYARCNPEYEDVLYTNIGVNYGTACLNDLEYEFSMKNVALLKPNKEFINGYYLWICLNLMREYILDMNKVGGAQTFLGLATIKRIKIPIPPLSLQQEFINVINQINQSKKTISQSIEELQLLFESLMQEYFG